MQRWIARLCVPALCAAPSAQGAAVALGSVPEYVFRTPLIRGAGETRLSDFRGQPVLVQFWNSTLWGAVDDMMKLVLRVQLEHEDDLQVILVEARLEPAALERLLLEKGWLGTRALWTTERPFAHGEQDPCCVLLSREGAVILKSPPLGRLYDRTYSNQFLDEIDAAVEAEVERCHGLLPESSPAVRKACADFASGKLARALASVRALGAGDPPAAHARSTFERQIERRIGRVELLLGRGRVGEAEAFLEPLAGVTELGDATTQRLVALRGELASEALKAEREADRALAKLEEALFEEGATERTSGALRSLAKRHAGTRRGAEAARLDALLRPE